MFAVNFKGLNSPLTTHVVKDEDKGAAEVLHYFFFNFILLLFFMLVFLDEVISPLEAAHHMLEHLTVPANFYCCHDL